MYLKMFFSSIPELPETEVQYSKTGNDIYDFSSDEQQCRFKERFRNSFSCTVYSFSFLSFHVCVIFVFFVVKG